MNKQGYQATVGNKNLNNFAILQVDFDDNCFFETYHQAFECLLKYYNSRFGDTKQKVEKRLNTQMCSINVVDYEFSGITYHTDENKTVVENSSNNSNDLELKTSKLGESRDEDCIQQYDLTKERQELLMQQQELERAKQEQQQELERAKQEKKEELERERQEQQQELERAKQEQQQELERSKQEKKEELERERQEQQQELERAKQEQQQELERIKNEQAQEFFKQHQDLIEQQKQLELRKQEQQNLKNTKKKSTTVKDIFNFEGGEKLTKMGAAWFVSYAYYEKIDTKHLNWDVLQSSKSKVTIYKRTTDLHNFWLQQLKSISASKLSNKIGLIPTQINKMIEEILNEEVE
ncbi:MAG: hypothetical protein FWF58_02090 [Firmicutes bacterium]|nr:hypothetical protein [Bacillota bacterium]